VHVEVSKMLRAGHEIVMIGHRGHPEAEGTMGQASSGMHLVETVEDVATLRVASPERLSYVTQTTLSVDDARAIVAALKARFPSIHGPKKDDICYATQNRQDAVKFMAPQCDVVIVVGSPNSSNSNRLREVAQHMGAQAYMVDRAADLKPEWIAGKRRIGVTAGASGAAGAGGRAARAAESARCGEREDAARHYRACGVHPAARARARLTFSSLARLVGVGPGAAAAANPQRPSLQ
jgi:4-hydroxy-3-methylbut-2-enyl diphosphate reductase